MTLCAWCHRPTRPVWVHGHAQCQHCRINIEPCCGGDEACPAEGWTPPRTLAGRSSRDGR